MSKLNSKASVGCLVRCGDALVVVYEQQDDRGAWDIPAGGIEANETPLQAITRELQEEIGLELKSVDQSIRLLDVFWATIAGTLTVHFLYEVTISQAQADALKPHTSDIEKVALFSRQEVQDVLDTKAYEHELAKERLLFFLSEAAKPTKSIHIV